MLIYKFLGNSNQKNQKYSGRFLTSFNENLSQCAICIFLELLFAQCTILIFIQCKKHIWTNMR